MRFVSTRIITADVNRLVTFYEMVRGLGRNVLSQSPIQAAAVVVAPVITALARRRNRLPVAVEAGEKNPR